MPRVIPKFRARVVKGKLQLDDAKKFDEYLLSLPCEVSVVVKPYRQQRSNPQNRYYWGVVINILSNELGYTKEETHDVMRAMFLTEWIEVKGSLVKIIRSTISLKTVEMEEYLERIRCWASQENINIPLPNEIDL